MDSDAEIVFDTPPDSPVLCSFGDEEDQVDELTLPKLISPQKRPRRILIGRTTRRKRAHDSAQVSPSPWDDHQFFGADRTEDSSEDLITRDQTSYTVPEDYETYIDFVLDDAVGLYQIGMVCFVVQGWDARYHTGTVCGFKRIC
jgi:hypothetical protein